MAGVVFGGTVPLADDAHMRMAELARQIAENEEDWLRLNGGCADRSGESSPTVAGDGYDITLQSDSGNAEVISLATPCLSLQVPNELQELRAKNNKLSIKVDELTNDLKSKTLAYNKVMMQIKLQDENLEKTMLTHEEALKQVTTLEDHCDALIKALDQAHQQLKESPGTVSSLRERIDRLHDDKDILREKIEHLSEERHRLRDDLRCKNVANAQLQQNELQYTGQVNSLRLELGNMKTLQSQLKDKVAEIKSLKTDMAFYVTQLDLADRGCRAFTCSHDHLANLPDRNKSTRALDAGSTAWNMFRACSDDQVFMDAYHESRQKLVKHHRAHEQNDPGRGDEARTIKRIFLNVDERRGVSFEYK
ncbi:hypothetical protein SLS60_006886 [Paraconiothyrium brasiliense]|uniref:Uncharacterized protein n=1 Tax=Paraconiothyrium brasiliense TaxID=300254 RepID=A0ABR3R7T1_9PLEO